MQQNIADFQNVLHACKLLWEKNPQKCIYICISKSNNQKKVANVFDFMGKLDFYQP